MGRRASVGCWILLFLSLLRFCHSKLPPKYTFLKQATEAPAVSHYDYVIVGGGTAGCPLAATLSRNFDVLLLERGGSPYGNKNISNLGSFADTLSDTSPESASQRFVSTDGVISSRARVLGGGSCLNAGFYSRATPDDVRRAGWNSRLVNDSFAWVERVVAFKPVTLEWQSAVRDGLLEAGVTPNNGFTYDHIIGTKVGGSIFDKDGHRHTAADLLEYADGSRLTVLLRATVTRILWKQEGKVRPAAQGVVFRDATGRRKWAYVREGGEVVVSAGALGSPQLLMLSGVGPRDQLGRLGIRVLVEQPLVGQGMSDNPMNAIFVASPSPVELSLIQVVGITKFGSYIQACSGRFFPSYNNGTPPPRSTYFGMFSPQTGQLSTVPPKQRTQEAIDRAVKAMNSLDQSVFRGGFILEKVLGPLSTGHLEVKSLNPDDNPTVTFNYFSHPLDLKRCVEGLKVIERVILSNAFSKFRYPSISIEALLNESASFPVNLRPRHSNDSSSLSQYCRDTVLTIWHYHGGCQVGQVVDRNYRVLGVDSLRVIDGSTFRFSPGTNPQATVMMLGRYMGVKIRNERLQTKTEG